MASRHPARRDILHAVRDPSSALEVEGLFVRFDETTVLDHLSFSVPRATSLAILGPNGAGKTVLFKALTGALPFEGQIRWAKDMRLGYVPQKLDIERDLPVTAADFLRAKVAVTGVPRADVARATAAVGFPDALLRKPIGALSGGQFQRLLVAVALVGEPSVLLLDEPTAGVDQPGQENMNATIERLCRERGMTVLFISHDLSVVYRYASNVLCLAHGGSPCLGAPASVLTPAMLEQVYGAPVGYHVHDWPRS
jgi:zinc transport system ATP-binding protein